MVRIFRIEDIPVEIAPDGRVRRVVNEETGAARIGVIFVEKPPKHGPMKYHYHVKRESVYIVTNGRARATIDGKDYLLEPNTVVIISPGEKHKVTNAGGEEFRMIEVYAPLEPDWVDVPREERG